MRRLEPDIVNTCASGAQEMLKATVSIRSNTALGITPRTPTNYGDDQRLGTQRTKSKRTKQVASETRQGPRRADRPVKRILSGKVTMSAMTRFIAGSCAIAVDHRCAFNVAPRQQRGSSGRMSITSIAASSRTGCVFARLATGSTTTRRDCLTEEGRVTPGRLGRMDIQRRVSLSRVVF